MLKLINNNSSNLKKPTSQLLAPLTQFGQVVFVVEAPLAIRHVLEVNFALVSHAVDVGGAVGPGDAGHAAAGLSVPTANVHHLPNLSLPACTANQHTQHKPTNKQTRHMHKYDNASVGGAECAESNSA